MSSESLLYHVVPSGNVLIWCWCHTNCIVLCGKRTKQFFHMTNKRQPLTAIFVWSPLTPVSAFVLSYYITSFPSYLFARTCHSGAEGKWGRSGIALNRG